MTLFRISHPSYRWIILGCGVLAYAASFFVRWSYTGLAPYISEDLNLDKAALGLLGGVFFYPYALAQIPWGWLADRWGGRMVIGMGVMLSAVGLLCFASAMNLWSAMVWRMVLGVVAATAFVPIASLLANWFSTAERGLANGAYYGFGGGLGQGAAFLLMPYLAVYFLQGSTFPISGWRGAMVLIAVGLGCVGVLCLLFIRSFPSNPHNLGAYSDTAKLSLKETEENRFNFLSIGKDSVFWLLGMYFSLSLVALRLVPAWISLYANDVFRLVWSYERDAAMIAGGSIGALYTVGHIVGSPLLGKLSDWGLGYGIQRLMLPTISLGLGGLLVSVFLMTLPSPYVLGGVSFLLGVFLHAFPIMSAAVSERWGISHTGRCLGGINMVGQIVGAIALSVSGYVGIAFSENEGDLIGEFQGIWYGVMACGVVGAMCGWFAHTIMMARPKKEYTH